MASQRSRNRRGFIDAYNKSAPDAPYGSPAWFAKVGNQLGPMGSNASTPPPFDAEREAARTRGTQRRTTLLSDLDVDVQQRANETGFKYNPATGAFGGFDPTNPFSQAALLMKSRKQRDKGENTSFASSGQLYSGAYKAAQKETGNAYDRGYDTLRRGFQDYVKQYLRRKRDISSTPIEELASL